MILLYIATIIFGIVNAYIWAIYVDAIATKSALKAALNDFIIIAGRSGILQLWALRDSDLGIMLAWAFANAVGTYLCLRIRK